MKTIFLFIFLALANSTTAQVYKFRASSFSVTERLDNGSWSEWSPFEKSIVVITLDAKKERIVINSQDIQVFEIMEYAEKIETDQDIIIGFRCANIDGGKVDVEIVTRKNQENRKQVYVNYSDLKYVYNIYD